MTFLNHIIPTIAPKNLQSVECVFKQSAWKFKCVKVKLVKGKVTVTDQNEFSDISELLSFLDKALPLLLCFSGENVIYKPTISKNNPEETFKSTFAGADSSQFVIQQNQGQEVLCAAIRQSEIENIVNAFKEHKLVTLSINLGPTILAMAEIAKINITPIQSDFYVYENIGNIQHSKPVLIETDIIEIAAAYLISWNQALLYFINQLPVSSGVPLFVTSESEYKQMRLWNVFSVFVPLFFLLILLVNYFYFSSLKNEVQELEMGLALHQNEITEMELLSKSIDNKKRILLNSGFKSNAPVTSLSDFIGSSLPGGLTLTSMHFNPLKDKIKPSKQIEYISEEVIIQGQSNDALELNDWIETLKASDYIKDCTLQSLVHNSKSGVFQIKLVIQ
jgi:hypothetical protein